MNSVDIRPAQYRKCLIWGWSCVVVVLIAVNVIAAWPHSAATIIALPGVVALGIALTTLNMGYGRTRLTPEGISTHRFLTRHSCPWSEVAGISTKKTETKSGRGRGTFRNNVIISRPDGERFRLAAPYDTSNMRDPQFFATTAQIKDYQARVLGEQAQQQPG